MFAKKILWLFVLVSIFFIITESQLSRVKTVGHSMSGSLKFGVSYTVIDHYYSIFQPKRGDIIKYSLPFKTENTDARFISRIIGLPGETIKVQGGHVYIDGSILEENYVFEGEVTREGSFLREAQAVTIPEKNYVIMGDKRSRSSDSREWGFITTENMHGKLIVF